MQGALDAQEGSGPAQWTAPVAVGALEGLGLVWHECGASAEAEAAFEAAVQRAGEDPALRARALSGLALPSVRAGDEARALSLLHAALNAAERAGDRLLIGRIVNNIGIVHHGAGRYTDALACFHRSRALRQGLGYRNGVAINLHNVGDTHLRMGDRARAFAAFHKSRDLCVAARWERGEVLNDTFLAWLDLDGNPDQEAWQAAYARLLEASRRARDLADLETALTGAWLQGRALVGQGEVAQAAAVLEAALGEAEELDAASLARDLRASLAGCAAPG